MKLIFFGSGHGSPEPHRRCSSTLIEVEGNRYFIDMGTQAIEQLVDRGIPAESVKAIFITHMHGDHTNGLISFLDLCSWKFLAADPLICLPGDIEATKKALAGWLSCNNTKLRPFTYENTREGLVFDDGLLRVTAYKTGHIDFSYAYLIEAHGKRVLFSGDLSHKPADDFPRAVLSAPLDLAICEAAHFEATEYLPILAENANLRRLCFNHYSPRFLPSVLKAREILSQTVDTVLASDGLEIEV